MKKHRTLACLAATALLLVLLAGCSTKQNYSATKTNTSFAATYQKLDGEMKETVEVTAPATLYVTVTTEAGRLDIAFGDEISATVFQDPPSGEEASVELERSGKYTITFNAYEHRGGFDIRWG